MTNIEFERNIRLILKGEKIGLQEIYVAYGATIYSVVYQVIKNKENLEDITFEFFIKLWNNTDTYKFGLKHKKWLGTMAYNMAIDFIRKHNKEILTDEISEKVDVSNSVENNICQKIAFEDCLKYLEETERLIINLKILCDLTFKDISKLLNIPLGTVTWKYQNAIKRLRRAIHE